MKKSILFSMIASATIAICGCQEDDNYISNPNEKKATHQVTVNVSNAESRTSIEAVPGGYLSTWNAGDNIALFEYNPSAPLYEEIREYWSAELQESDIVDGKASFTVELETDEPSNATYEYISTYGPYSYYNMNYWTDAQDEAYKSWAEQFDYTGEYIPSHMVLNCRFEEYQYPTATSFDPSADLMVSQPMQTVGQLHDALTLKFARLGTIVKITLTGLQDYQGKTINRAEIEFGKSYSEGLNILYDYKLEKYIHKEFKEARGGDDMTQPTRYTIEPEEVSVKEDGTADLWLRTYAGTLTDKFSIALTLTDDEDNEILLGRKVDLSSSGNIIEFKEGGMTVFSVGSWGLADVEGVYNCETEVNEARDGFKATWAAVENAVGYDCYLYGWLEPYDENGDPETEYPETPVTAVDNGDGTWSVTVANGLQPMNYALFIKPIPAEGHCLMYDSYEYFEVKVGVPEVWHFHHDCFGGNNSYEAVEGVDDEYLIPELSPGVVRFKNVWRSYDSSWQVLKANGPWFMYSTQPLKEIHSIELYSKNDSHLNFKVYASKTPNEHTKELEGVVIESSYINAGYGSNRYEATHKKVRYTFPEDETYQYFTICGESAGIVMTSQVTYVYYFK